MAGPPPIPLPPLPAKTFMSDAAWDVFYAMLDGILPSIVPASQMSDEDKDARVSIPDEEMRRVVADAMGTIDGGPSEDDVAEFLSYRVVEDEAFREICLRSLSRSQAKVQVGKILGFMGTNIGSLILTGHWKPIHKQPSRVRQAVVQSWASSRFGMLRQLMVALCVMAHRTHGMTDPLFHTILGYPKVPLDWKPVDGYPFNFIQLNPGNEVFEIVTDIVIVGSGYGGSVSAKNLAEAGHQVLVVDKGYYFPPSQLPLTQASSAEYLFESGGVFQNDAGTMTPLFASCWGGGGTVNWSVCFRPPEPLRREWAEGGLPLFTTREFDECVDRVWEFVGAGRDAVRHNHRNNVLLNGAKKLGWHGDTCDLNTANKEHYCGHCHDGCASGEKRGPAISWLPAAAEAGAQFMEGFQVGKVLFDQQQDKGGVPKAIGVEGVWTSRGADGSVHGEVKDRTQRRVVIKAKKVIISAGSMWSPIILMKSGIKNSHVGRNLHLHPVGLMMGMHKEETRPWEGGVLTSYCKQFANLDGKWHGAILEPVAMSPQLSRSTQSWHGGLDSKLLALRYRHQSNYIAMVRDRDGGRVYVDPVTGQPRLDWKPSSFDTSNILEGLRGLAKILYASGATEIRANMFGLAAFRPDASAQEKLGQGEDPESTDAAFAEWLQRMRDAAGGRSGKAAAALSTYTGAHQMGSCRMSAKAESGVVDSKGKVWRTENLYVADASVFPSASGVNPMVTVMAVADWISRGIVTELSG